MKSITIPASVTSIGEKVFHDCECLATIIVDKNNTTYDSRNECNAIIETATNKLLYGCAKTVIPNTVISINDRAFVGCRQLRSIKIPESVIEIGEYAFGFCDTLTSISIPKSVTKISSNAFEGCDSLKL